jgi:hypothetical protein
LGSIPVAIDSTGNTVKINGAELQTNGGSINMKAGGNIDGDGTNILDNFDIINANQKNFDILHPSKKEPWRLRYSVLEGPEVGVFVRGRLQNCKEILLPYYWADLIHSDSISVILTPIGKPCLYFVEEILDNKILIGGNCEEINLFYTVFAERKDVERLVVEYIQSNK